jgi:hypothetical protein
MERVSQERRHRRTAWLLSAILALSAALLVACGDDDDQEADASEEPVPGGTLTFGTGSEPTGFDPKFALVPSSYVQLQAVYDVLISIDPRTEKVIPRIAESVVPNEAETVWTVKLRRGVTFSDGTPLDAAAVKAHLGPPQRPGHGVAPPRDAAAVRHVGGDRPADVHGAPAPTGRVVPRLTDVLARHDPVTHRGGGVRRQLRGESSGHCRCRAVRPGRVGP